MSRLHVKIAALAAVLMLSAAPGLAEDAKIKIANFTFDPPTLTVKAGTTVTWVNIVVSEQNGTFRSNALDTDESFTQTFPAAGTIEYFCAIHPRMTGKIIVTP
jgi:plastocyanin